MSVNIQIRRDTAAAWTSNNPILLIGELGYETDTLKHKMGDGVNPWTALAYTSTGGGTGTVTSVGLTAPALMTASGSPVTTSGSLALAWNGSVDSVVRANGDTIPMTIGSNGDLVYTHPTGQKLFNGNYLYSWTYQGGGIYSNFTLDGSIQGTTETTIIDQTSAGRNGLYPILSANYLLSGFGPLWVRIRGGYGLVGATPTLTVRVYLGATVVLTKVIDYSTVGITSGDNTGYEILFWLEPINEVSPGTSLRLRGHQKATVSKGNANGSASFVCNEDETYSNINGTVAQNIKITAQWSAVGTTTWAFFDGIEVYR